MLPTKTHRDATADDLVETDGHFLFVVADLDALEANLVRSRLNHDGEGHKSREVAIVHLSRIQEMERAIRERVSGPVNP